MTKYLLLLTLLLAPLSQAQQAPKLFEKKEQLKPGKAPGTYAFSYSSSIVFSQEAVFPVNFSIEDYAHKSVFKFPVNDSKPFTITTDLAPGGYWIGASPPSDKDAVYWGSQFFSLFIDQTGLATSGDIFNNFVLLKKMTVLSPKGSIVETDKRPVLNWEPLPGAVSYRVQWLVETAPQVVSTRGTGETTETQFRLTEDAIPERQYEWSVDAIGKDGKQIGYWASAYFFTPGGKEAFEKAPKMTPKPTKGTSYLGLSPMRPLRGAESEVQGIYVTSVGANSPALKAGLQPGDTLTTFDGKPLDTVSIPEFVNLVRAKTAGTVVPIDFVRQGEKKSVTVTIEEMP